MWVPCLAVRWAEILSVDDECERQLGPNEVVRTSDARHLAPKDATAEVLSSVCALWIWMQMMDKKEEEGGGEQRRRDGLAGISVSEVLGSSRASWPPILTGASGESDWPIHMKRRLKAGQKRKKGWIVCRFST